MNFLARTFPVVIAFVLGWLAIILEFIPSQIAGDTMTYFTKGLIIMAAVTTFFGSYNLLKMHYMKIRRKNAGWGYSLITWTGFLIMMGFAIFNNGKGFWNPQESTGGVTWIYDSIFTPCQATMFSILAFYIASAAYRTFRAKSLEAILLLGAALIVMFGVVPISAGVSHWFPESAQWLLEYPNLAVKRAIYFGVALGGISTALRIIFGIERSYLGGE